MKKIKIFLICALAFTAFLGGYLLVRGDIGILGGIKNQTGTILDKFRSSIMPNFNDTAKKDTKLNPIVDRDVISLTSSLNKNAVLYYEQDTGKAFEYNLTDKTETPIYDKLQPNFISSIWSPTKEEVISAFYSQTGFEFKYYDYKNNRSGVLGLNTRSAVFSPDGDYIAYYYLENVLNNQDSTVAAEEVGRVTISRSDGSLPKIILNTRFQDLMLLWPAKDRIIIATPKSGVFSLTEDGKLKKIFDPIPTFEQNWSKTGEMVLFSGLTDLTKEAPMLSVEDPESGDVRSLNISGNASKCVWSMDNITVYCALSNSPSTDNIYKINTLNGSKELISELGIAVKEMVLSSSEDMLVYISAANEKLYSLPLP